MVSYFFQISHQITTEYFGYNLISLYLPNNYRFSMSCFSQISHWIDNKYFDDNLISRGYFSVKFWKKKRLLFSFHALP